MKDVPPPDRGGLHQLPPSCFRQLLRDSLRHEDIQPPNRQVVRQIQLWPKLVDPSVQLRAIESVLEEHIAQVAVHPLRRIRQIKVSINIRNSSPFKFSQY